MNTPPVPGTKENRIAVAKSRVEFWRIWSDEASTPEAKEYFMSRKTHWEYALKAAEMEP